MDQTGEEQALEDGSRRWKAITRITCSPSHVSVTYLDADDAEQVASFEDRAKAWHQIDLYAVRLCPVLG